MIFFGVMAHIIKVAAVVVGSIVLDCMVEWLILIIGMMLILMHRTCKEVILIMWVALLSLIRLMQLGVVDVVVLNAMNS